MADRQEWKWKCIRVLGITGGVGAGKSTILGYLERQYGARIIELDQVARQLQEPGGSCYDSMVDLFGMECVRKDGTLDRAKIAEKVYQDAGLLEKLNRLVHPAVKKQVLADLQSADEAAESERAKGRSESCLTGADGNFPGRLVVIESALLIDDQYDRICDEIWYIYAAQEKRRERLKASRGYSDRRIDSMFAAQRSEESFRKNTQYTIDNTDDIVQNTFGQMDQALRERGWIP